jgi:NAD(P)-dependent dehydrogenase (short-subunit alcohol dehydrogenase family)
VLVLGGSGVLGSSIARELCARGANVVLAGRNADRLRQQASYLGEDVPSVIGDLRQPHHAVHVVETACTLLGGLDGVVNAAGVVAFGPFSDLPDEALDELAAADLVGPLRVIRAALTKMDGGFIVNVTGVVAEQPMAGLAAYSAMKAGLSAATEALGRELRREGVHVLDARPPHTETGLARRPIAGTAPEFPKGLDPRHVAVTIVDGLAAGRRELPSDSFAPARA